MNIDFEKTNELGTTLRENINGAYDLIKETIENNGGYIDFRCEERHFMPTLFKHEPDENKPLQKPMFILAAKICDNGVVFAVSENYGTFEYQFKVEDVFKHFETHMMEENEFYCKETILNVFFTIAEFQSII